MVTAFSSRTKTLAKSQPSTVCTARLTTAFRVSAALPAENSVCVDSDKLTMSSEMRASGLGECSAPAIKSSICMDVRKNLAGFVRVQQLEWARRVNIQRRTARIWAQGCYSLPPYMGQSRKHILMKFRLEKNDQVR